MGEGEAVSAESGMPSGVRAKERVCEGCARQGDSANERRRTARRIPDA